MPDIGLKELAIYIHVPFCDHKCIYCDFYSIITSDNISSFLQSLKKEIKNYAENYSSNRIITSVKEPGISHANFQTKILNELAADNNFITVNCESFKCSAKGIDKVEFFISAIQGEDPKPLAKVVPGGEISRIMLSLISTLAKNDKLPLLIFDEIDVGDSGRIAQKVGSVLKDLAEYHQIIAITHLSQLAGLADYHYTVEKAQ